MPRLHFRCVEVGAGFLFDFLHKDKKAHDDINTSIKIVIISLRLQPLLCYVVTATITIWTVHHKKRPPHKVIKNDLVDSLLSIKTAFNANTPHTLLHLKLHQQITCRNRFTIGNMDFFNLAVHRRLDGGFHFHCFRNH